MSDESKVEPADYFRPDIIAARSEGFAPLPEVGDCSDAYIHSLVDTKYIPEMNSAATRARLDEVNWAAQKHSEQFNACHPEGAHWMRLRCNDAWNANRARFADGTGGCTTWPLGWECRGERCGWVDPCTGEFINSTGIINIPF